MKSRIVCKCNVVNFIGVENDHILKHINYWQYPTNMKSWNNFIGQWKIKRKIPNVSLNKTQIIN